MNTRLDFIFTRRSVRKYLDKDIPAAMLHDLLEAGMAAPSARAADPLHFIVITERAGLDAIATVLPYAKMLHSAPAAIVVCGDPERAPGGSSQPGAGRQRRCRKHPAGGHRARSRFLLAGRLSPSGPYRRPCAPSCNCRPRIVPVAGIALGLALVAAAGVLLVRKYKLIAEDWR